VTSRVISLLTRSSELARALEAEEDDGDDDDVVVAYIWGRY
jgi:hypothetical protein